jgi:hypothetical protein
MPFSAPQKRPDDLPFAIVATDTIPAMDRHRELAPLPALVNVIIESSLHHRHQAVAPKSNKESAGVQNLMQPDLRKVRRLARA